ncbi:hypothetical protein [Pseudoalteromonas luteoviolacea]|uniref:Uncharacterized protein n=1 Tax=Pseudoalteromonas luteoviolacea S4054 TaxID=1129367 RepID=A0A0F6AD77_9GAMM|nr:hypothetical protein [Pseudoalteromonas luteoviolacea]AOT08246.1 hypothetical protein S4054249_10515 [Pseudoalteromonas luteoviolacea]AOT13162.1 hypothetical protein S40542_10490 [Pseudoalteromonas luteoviolacea]AOT18074.1 hypothetical protein S4054_10485 [Pseudoalteromonas luteoviolacea]KKE84177.1 hypothetical protein N479_09770 [Pseudoalteromonas luteoviolacea S4054]KZN76218.1 hypothetical protein N481_07645 [Pseudoalteromonas luteoviolacea S4047-1]
MATEKKQRVVRYKRVKFSSDHHLTLQEMLEEKLLDETSDYYKAIARREPLSEDGNSFRFINHRSKHNQELFMCQLVKFEQDKSQLMIAMDEEAEAFSLTPITAKDIKKDALKERDNSEFLESLLYFAVLDNHLVMLSGKGIDSRDLEEHLAWFLNSLTGCLSNSMVILSDKPSEKAINKVKQFPPKSVKIGSAVTFTPKVNSTKHENFTEVVNQNTRVVYEPRGLAAKFLNFLKQEGYAPNLDFDESYDKSNLKLEMVFKFNRTTTKTGQKLVHDVAEATRHMEEEDVRIGLQEGGELVGQDVRLTKKIQVTFINGKVDDSGLYQKLRDWLLTIIDNSDVGEDIASVLKAEE